MEKEIAIPTVKFNPPKNLEKWLIKRKACDEAMAFCDAFYFDFIRCWDRCMITDWMLRLLRKRTQSSDVSYRLFACWCARLVWHLLPDERSRNGVIVAEKYALNMASDTELSWARLHANNAMGNATGSTMWTPAEAAAWTTAQNNMEDAAWSTVNAVTCVVPYSVQREIANKLREIFIPIRRA